MYHRALDGDAPAPVMLWIAQLSEAFDCLPSAAYEEWQRWPAGFLEGVLEARGYMQAKQAVEDATRGDSFSKLSALQRLTQAWPLAALANQIRMELAAEQIHAG